MRAVSRRWEIPFSFVFLDFTSTCGEQPFRACSHDPGQLIASGQLTDPGVHFASVHCLTSVTVHNFEKQVTRCTIPGNRPCQGNFSPCEQNVKVAPGQEQSCACSLLMFRIYFPINNSRKHQK